MSKIQIFYKLATRRRIRKLKPMHCEPDPLFFNTSPLERCRRKHINFRAIGLLYESNYIELILYTLMLTEVYEPTSD